MHTIKCLELFKAVAEHKSFTRVAAANNIAPSAVTRAIQELETELGVRLFHRTTRKLSVTDVGMSVYNRAVSLLDNYSEIKGISEACSGTMSGTVRVAIQRLLGFDSLSLTLEFFRHVALRRQAVFGGEQCVVPFRPSCATAHVARRKPEGFSSPWIGKAPDAAVRLPVPLSQPASHCIGCRTRFGGCLAFVRDSESSCESR